MKYLFILLIVLVSCKHPESESLSRDINQLSISTIDSLQENDLESNIEENQYKVIGIIDGDTYDISKNNKSERIRIDGIDAPEKGMPFYKVSKKHLSNLIYSKYIRIEFEKKDRYGRWVAKGYIDDSDISEEMIKAGMAWHFKKYSDNEILSNLEIKARNLKLGLWQETTPVEPWEVRKLHKNGISTKERFEKKIAE
ncbi:thermonuclease family protein [Flavobacterium sp. LB2R40]|uniref:thermonuclease family protein n=1 Tax=Flavobacterium sp. LB2R40 TaxID=3401722 RepID=UPI003AAF9EE9